MIIYPAIDLRNGKCVRLYQGDYQKETVYALDPFAQVSRFADEGATWVHLIDLDGAKNPSNNQEILILKLLKSVSSTSLDPADKPREVGSMQRKVSIQIGGGIRSAEQIEKYLGAGASRVIIGSLAVQDPDMVLAWFQRFGADRLVLALDVAYDKNNQPWIATNAWQTTSTQTLEGLISMYQAVDLQHVLCTDIARDGTLQGPSIALYESLLKKFPSLQIQASGGVHALSDLVLLREKGLRSAIIGRALYEEKFTVLEALSC